MNANNSGAARRRSSSGPVHVLHIEDDDEWAKLVDFWLSRRGFKVLRLSSCVEMRSYLSRCPSLPLCLLLDLTLPDGDGLEVCGEIKASPVLQRLPIVILSGRSVTSGECLKCKAIYRVAKDAGAEGELVEVLGAILDQSERSQGVVDVGDLRLDPRGGEVSLADRPVASLELGPFAALLMMVQSSPRPVEDLRLYDAFCQRCVYHKRDPELSIRSTLRNYVSRLRGSLGETLAARIQFVHREGYAYRPPPRL